MDEVIDALRRTLEAHGVPADRARRLAEAQSTDANTESRRQQHVVPVATGWLVITGITLTDAEVFANREAAVERARQLAAAQGCRVIVHDAADETSTL